MDKAIILPKDERSTKSTSSTTSTNRRKHAMGKTKIDIDTGRFWDRGINLIDGTIRMHTERLEKIIKTKTPTVWAIWNDLYHEDVPVSFMDYFLEVVDACKQHTFLVVTKRPQNIVLYRRELSMRLDCRILAGLEYLPNLWNILTVCNQQEADEKIPAFLQVPGNKGLMIEPMLSAIDLEPFFARIDQNGEPYGLLENRPGVVIVAGPGARPLHPDWIRQVRGVCQSAGTPFFFKSWGAWEIASDENGYSGSIMPDTGKKFRWVSRDGETSYPAAKGADCYAMARVGSKKSGRLLDGIAHNDLPWLPGSNGR